MTENLMNYSHFMETNNKLGSGDADNMKPHEVNALVKEAVDAFKNPRDDALKWRYLRELEIMLPSNIWTHTQQEFMVNHFARFLTVLIDHLDPKLFTEKWQEELFDSFFLKGIYHEVFMVLTSAVSETESSYKLDKVISLLEALLSGNHVNVMFKAQCIVGHQEGQWTLNTMLWDQLISCLVFLPDKIANKLMKTMNRKVFEPSQYFIIMSKAHLAAMEYVHERLTTGQDSSVEFLSRFLGKSCAAGHADVCLDFLLPILTQLCATNFLWQKICQRVFVKGQDRCLEAVITPLLRKLKWYKQVEWFLGDTVTSSEKLKFLLTTKLLLIRYFEEDVILHNIIGYLAQNETRQPLLFKAFDSVLDAWGSTSGVKHQPHYQHFYLTKCLMICIAHMKKLDVGNYKKSLNEKFLLGVHPHLASSLPSIQVMGMVVAENLTPILLPVESILEFEYEKTPEVEHLLSLLEIPSEPKEEVTEKCRPVETASGAEEAKVHSNAENSDHKVSADAAQVPKDTDQQLDSDDDDFEAFDMKHDESAEKQKVPRYVRDCLQGLVEQDKPEWTQACLKEAEKLIRHQSSTMKEIAVEMAKVLLNLQDTYATPDYVALRHRALIATIVQSPKEVAEYLTSQFYDRNYSIRQRLDILEVLAAASQELSCIKVGEVTSPLSDPALPSIVNSDPSANVSDHWKDAVDKRIESKTRRFARGRRQIEPLPQKNKFGPVAGYFFYPLLRHFDRKENTFDLLGEDHHVLGRMIYTLGVILHAASNTPAARQMGASLLSFVWCFRYHTEVFVRRALIYALCMVLIDIPSHILLTDFQGDVYECQLWLEEMMEKDPDPECQRRARQVLGVLAGIIKKEISES